MKWRLCSQCRGTSPPRRLLNSLFGARLILRSRMEFVDRTAMNLLTGMTYQAVYCSDVFEWLMGFNLYTDNLEYTRFPRMASATRTQNIFLSISFCFIFYTTQERVHIKSFVNFYPSSVSQEEKLGTPFCLCVCLNLNF